MPLRSTLTLPTNAALPSFHRISSSNPAVIKTLLRLSRQSLLQLVQEWLKTQSQQTCRPVLGERENETESFYDPAYTLEELQEIYAELAERKGGKREVLDRVLEGDWRDGISLRQLAMADVQYLLDHPTSQRWIALKLVEAKSEHAGSSKKRTKNQDERHIPAFYARTFLKNLQREIGPLMKAHYHTVHHPTLALTLLRISIHDSPYNSQPALTQSNTGSWRTILVAFPDDSPYIYLSLSSPQQAKSPSTLDGKSLRTFVIDAIPKAMSRPGTRYTLITTSLSAKNLSFLLSARGTGGKDTAVGGWTIYTEGTAEETPLATTNTLSIIPASDKENLPPNTKTSTTLKRPAPSDSTNEPRASKHRRLLAESRFGPTALPADGKGLDKLSIRLEEPFPLPSSPGTSAPTPQVRAHSSQRPQARGRGRPPKRRGRRSELSQLEEESSILSLQSPSPSASANETFETEDAAGTGTGLKPGGKPWVPKVQLTFHGAHVFAGMRALVEGGAVDGKRMPGWMVGEGVSVGVVRGGELVKGGAG